MKTLFRFLFTKYFAINTVIIILLAIAGLWGLFQWLGSYTQHGQTITVPSFIGQSVDGLDEFASSRELQYVIIDSVPYDNTRKKGTVLEQDPREGDQAKRGRKVYLTVIGKSPSMAILNDDFLDFNRSRVAFFFKQKKLNVTFRYAPGEEENVLKAYVKGKNGEADRVLKEGDQLRTGTDVVVVIGQGGAGGKVSIPDLIGLTLDEATEYLESRGLNLGLTEFVNCETPDDSLMARVLKQDPLFDEDKGMLPGQAIKIFLSTDAPERIEIDSNSGNDPNENL